MLFESKFVKKNKRYAVGLILRENFSFEIQSSLPQSEFYIKATRTSVFIQTISTDSEELKIVNCDSDDMNEEEYEKQFPLVLDLSDDEAYT